MPTTPPIIISREVDKSIDEINEKIINTAKELYYKHMTKIKNNINNNNKKIPTYKCINKINGLECKGCRVDRKGTGLVLNKGDKCFDCQFYGVPWLQTQAGSSSNSTQFLSPVRSPSSPRHRRSASFCTSPTSPTFTEESEVDPYMFEERPNYSSSSLQRQKAIIKKKESNKKSLLISEKLSNKLTIQITQPDSGISTLYRDKEEETLNDNNSLYISEEIEVVSSTSQDLISSPQTPRTPIIEVMGDRFKINLESVVAEICHQVLNLREENELEKIKLELQTALVENQKLIEENELLKQEVKELKGDKFGSESSSFKDEQDILQMYIEVPPYSRF